MRLVRCHLMFCYVSRPPCERNIRSVYVMNSAIKWTGTTCNVTQPIALLFGAEAYVHELDRDSKRKEKKKKNGKKSSGISG